jgi:serine/threonine-protein kinase HipA
MNTEKHKNLGANVKVELEVYLGQAGSSVGKLTYVKNGPREFSQFSYREEWLNNPTAFDISPDLSRILGHQLHKPPTKNDSCFFLALADTAPDN